MSAKDSLVEVNKNGAFVRSESLFREFISQDHPMFKPEANRYHLFVAMACPWANRCLTVLNLRGLDSIIDISVVHPTWNKTRLDDEHKGWCFVQDPTINFTSSSGHGSFNTNGCTADKVNGFRTIRDIYEQNDFYGPKFTVPILYDTHTKKIVNNESSEIIRILNSSFNEWSNNKIDLCPKDLQNQIDDTNNWIYHDINNGVYKCGFAQSQEAYGNIYYYYYYYSYY